MQEICLKEEEINNDLEQKYGEKKGKVGLSSELSLTHLLGDKYRNPALAHNGRVSPTAFKAV